MASPFQFGFYGSIASDCSPWRYRRTDDRFEATADFGLLANQALKNARCRKT